MVETTRHMDLSRRNTFGMKVSCAAYVEITEEADLSTLDFDALPQPVFVMGGGSNLLFTRDFPGTVLHVAIPGIVPSSPTSPGPTPSYPTPPETSSSSSTQPGPTSSYPIQPGPIQSCPAQPETSSSSPTQPGPTPSCPARPGISPAGAAPVIVRVGAGVVFDDFCAWAAGAGLWGPENLSLIPGEVGASAVQNIGAYGVEAKDLIETVHAFDRTDGTFVDIPAPACGYGYRTSRFKTEWKGRYIITAVTFHLSSTPAPRLEYGGIRKALDGRPAATPQTIREAIIGIRREKLPDPAETGSAGSFFCNPVVSRDHFARIVETARADHGPDYAVPHYDVGDRVKVPAAWMIEQCGFKGRTLGGAQVYPKQPLVIVNASGHATPDEIIALERQVIDAVRTRYGITLHPEVEHV